MLAFRSEGDVESWCARRGLATGALIAPQTLWELSVGWYGDRLDAEWSRHSVQRRQALLDSAGLTSPFWDLAPTDDQR